MATLIRFQSYNKPKWAYINYIANINQFLHPSPHVPHEQKLQSGSVQSGSPFGQSSPHPAKINSVRNKNKHRTNTAKCLNTDDQSIMCGSIPLRSIITFSFPFSAVIHQKNGCNVKYPFFLHICATASSNTNGTTVTGDSDSMFVSGLQTIPTKWLEISPYVCTCLTRMYQHHRMNTCCCNVNVMVKF